MRLPGKGMSWKGFFKALKAEWKNDKASDVAGSVTFSALLAIFPFLLVMVSVARLVIDPHQLVELMGQLSKVAPPQVVQIIQERFNALGEGESKGLLTVGVVGALWAASGGIMALMRALNTAYGVTESRPFWKTRLLGIGMTLFATVLVLVAAGGTMILPAVAKFLGPAGTVLLWLRLPIAAVLMMGLWAVLYYVLPDVQQKFKFITPGSVIGVLLWVAASAGFSFYVSNFGKYDQTYGAIGGVIVLLLWMYISSQVVLLGAEINALIEHKSPEGKVAGAKKLSDNGVSGSKAEEGVKPVEVPDTEEGAVAQIMASRQGGMTDVERAKRSKKRKLMAAGAVLAFLAGRSTVGNKTVH